MKKTLWDSRSIKLAAGEEQPIVIYGTNLLITESDQPTFGFAFGDQKIALSRKGKGVNGLPESMAFTQIRVKNISATDELNITVDYGFGKIVDNQLVAAGPTSIFQEEGLFNQPLSDHGGIISQVGQSIVNLYADATGGAVGSDLFAAADNPNGCVLRTAFIDKLTPNTGDASYTEISWGYEGVGPYYTIKKVRMQGIEELSRELYIPPNFVLAYQVIAGERAWINLSYDLL